jgi:hypothetical protein
MQLAAEERRRGCDAGIGNDIWRDGMERGRDVASHCKCDGDGDGYGKRTAGGRERRARGGNAERG